MTAAIKKDREIRLPKDSYRITHRQADRVGEWTAALSTKEATGEIHKVQSKNNIIYWWLSYQTILSTVFIGRKPCNDLMEGASERRYWNDHRCDVGGVSLDSGEKSSWAPFFENLEFQQLIAAPFRPKHTINPFTSKEINSPQWISIVPRKI
jgi:hypothetical protein